MSTTSTARQAAQLAHPLPNVAYVARAGPRAVTAANSQIKRVVNFIKKMIACITREQLLRKRVGT